MIYDAFNVERHCTVWIVQDKPEELQLVKSVDTERAEYEQYNGFADNTQTVKASAIHPIFAGGHRPILILVFP